MPKGLQKSLEHLEVGHVQKISFCFRERFWEKRRKTPLAFMHAAPNEYFPTWWNLQPLRSNTLVAWQGGPKALEMSFWTEEKKIQAALKTLSKIFGISMVELNRDVVSWFTHDWSNDAFSRGAYSYVNVSGVQQAKSIAQPFSDTIFLAGEAVVQGPTRGTVNGALDSGRVAATQVLKS